LDTTAGQRKIVWNALKGHGLSQAATKEKESRALAPEVGILGVGLMNGKLL